MTPLTPEDVALVNWAGDAYPPRLQPLVARLEGSGSRRLRVNHGWWPLLNRLDNDIAAVAPRYRVTRVSEDLGVLDFLVVEDDLTDEIAAMVEGAQSESARTCEICADRGWLYRQGDWLVTLCVDHARPRGARPATSDADIAEAVPRLTERELAFSLSAGVPASALGAEAGRGNLNYARASATEDEAEMASWLTSADVARLLGTPTTVVNTLRQQGAILAGRRRNGRYAYPRWQFDSRNHPLRGLQQVLAMFEDDDAVGTSNLITARWEALDDMSAAQWLAQRRPAEAITQVLEDWWRA